MGRGLCDFMLRSGRCRHSPWPNWARWTMILRFFHEVASFFGEDTLVAGKRSAKECAHAFPS